MDTLVKINVTISHPDPAVRGTHMEALEYNYVLDPSDNWVKGFFNHLNGDNYTPNQDAPDEAYDGHMRETKEEITLDTKL